MTSPTYVVPRKPATLLSIGGLALSLASAPALGQGFPAEIELSDLLAGNGGDGSTGFALNGVDNYDFSGASVSSAGDVNGDGIDDLIVGAFGVDIGPRNDAGRSYIVFGRGTAFPAEFELDDLRPSAGGDGSLGFIIDGIDTFNRSGRSVSSAGDVNGDGIDDLIIGAPYADPNGDGSGQSYVVFGRSTAFPAKLKLSDLLAGNGGDGSTGFALNGVDFDDNSGNSVSSAGDVNGDGIDDLIIGADNVDIGPRNNAGRSYVVFGRSTAFPAEFELDDLRPSAGGDGSTGFIIDGIEANDYSGFLVSSAGDVNGDGIDDLIIGAPYADPNGDYSGQSYVVFGRNTPFPAKLKLSDLLAGNGGDGSTGFIIDGIDTYDYSGFSVSSAGDVNGDGIDDIIVGAFGVDIGPRFYSGRSYVVFGRGTAFPAEFDLDDLRPSAGGDGSTGFIIDGVDINDRSGRSVSSAGDVNGDGIDDLIIGATSARPNGDSSGQSYVVFGRSTPFPAKLKLSDLLAGNGGNGSGGFALNGVDNDDFSGRSVSSAGDVNGDGVDDLIIGAYRAGPNAGYSGQSYVVFGIDTSPSEVELADLLNANGGDGSTGFALNGVESGDFSGASVSSAGDVNGDGIDDLIIGATNVDIGPRNNAGRSYVVFGRGTAFPAEFELDDLRPSAGGNGSTGFIIDGIEAYDNSGRSVSSAGDVNGDGIDDIIIGAFGADPNGSNSGQSYVVFGRNTPFPAKLKLSDLLAGNGGDGSTGFALNGVDSGDRSGYSVSSAGDVNGDGIDDLIIGADNVDIGPRNNAGRSYVVFGRSTAFPAEFELDDLRPSAGGDGSTGFIIDGINTFDRSGRSVSSAGDVNGDGVDDLIISAPYADPNGSNSGQSYVVFGRGTAFPAKLKLSDLLAGNGGDGSTGFIINGVDSYDNSGNSVSSAGDVNGDGIDDIIVGAFGVDIGPRFYAGRSYVVFGRGTAFPAEFDLDDLRPSAGGDGSTGFIIDGIDNYDRSGRSVSSAGDVNGDGIDDLIIGAPSAEPNGSYSGQSYVVFGRSTPFPAKLKLSDLLAGNGGNGSTGFALNGVDNSHNSGRSVSSAGDVNGDGVDDLIISAPYADPNGGYSGQSYVVFGFDNTPPARPAPESLFDEVEWDTAQWVHDADDRPGPDNWPGDWPNGDWRGPRFAPGALARCSPADLDRNGVLNQADFLAFSTAYTAGDLLADLDHNGVLNSSDAQSFFLHYANGCR